jgi:ferric-dicitrate binding protein FerR (iron transport regulator)
MADFDRDTSDRRPDEDSGIARVLRAAGGRAAPSEEMKQAVRAAVHAEWRKTVARRGVRRAWMAAVASVMVAIVGVYYAHAWLTNPGSELVADVSRATGIVQVRSGFFGSWHTATQLHAGEDLRTGGDGRVALQLRDGVSLRLDHDTRIAFVDAGRINVEAGAVYVDSGTTPRASEHLRVGTPAGVVQHVGTQYEARIVNAGTRIRVREGRVNLTSERGGVWRATVGEQLLVTSSGDIRRDAIAPSDPQWDWAANAAPPFDSNGKSVRDFLMWVGRELGREIVFADAASEEEANRVVLSGSVASLTPSEALVAVLPTTALRGTEHDGKIEIALQSHP